MKERNCWFDYLKLYLFVILKKSGMSLCFLFHFRFSLPFKKYFRDVGEINQFRSSNGTTGDDLFSKFITLCKSLLNVFPKASIIYLGLSRTWRVGPKNPYLRTQIRHQLGFPVSFRARQLRTRGNWSGQVSTENRKRNGLKNRNEIVVLPAYRTLRNKFVRIFKTRFFPVFPEKIVRTNCAKKPPKKIFFNDVFFSLRESDVFDKFGHLSDSGVRLIIQRIEKVFELND